MKPIIERHDTDILILGTGGAGLFAALHAQKAAPDQKVTIAVKGLIVNLPLAPPRRRLEGTIFDSKPATTIPAPRTDRRRVARLEIYQTTRQFAST